MMSTAHTIRWPAVHLLCGGDHHAAIEQAKAEWRSARLEIPLRRTFTIALLLACAFVFGAPTPSVAESYITLGDETAEPPPPSYHTVRCHIEGMYLGVFVGGTLTVDAPGLAQPVTQPFGPSWDVATGTLYVDIPDTGNEQLVTCFVSVYDEEQHSTIDYLSTHINLQPNEVRRVEGLENDASSETFTFTAPGDYLRERWWQVKDQHGQPYNYQTLVSEVWQIGQNGCNIQSITTGGGFTNFSGKFPDRYGNHDGNSRINACSVIPSCSTESTQTISVGGKDFSHTVIWRCADVEIQR